MVNIEVMWRCLETGEKRALADFTISLYIMGQ